MYKIWPNLFDIQLNKSILTTRKEIKDMIKLLICLLLSPVFVSCSFLYDSNNIKELKEEEVRKSYCEKRGWDYKKMKKDICVVIHPEFKHFASIGTFVDDRSCMREECFFGGEYGSLAFLPPKALEYYGWKTNDKRLK